MSTFAKSNNSPSSNWFKESFSDDYLYVYSHRDDNEAEQQVHEATKHIPFEPGHSILDIACGNGRHMHAFARLGAKVTGVDLSETMLDQAKERFKNDTYPAQFMRMDMRYLTCSEKYDGVTMWFTSFGYFQDPAQDMQVLLNIAGLLKPDGWWWIDLPNPQFLLDNLVPNSEREIPGPNGIAKVREVRQVNGDRIEKFIEVKDKAGRRHYAESVRLYDRERFETMLQRARMTPLGTLGDYDGKPFGAHSPRQIWFGVNP